MQFDLEREATASLAHPDLVRTITISGKFGDDAQRYPIKAVREAIEVSKVKEEMTHDSYKKVVYWSDEDECFIGICP